MSALGRNEIAYQWTSLGGDPKLIVGGVLPGTDAKFYFIHDVAGLESALGLLRLGLGGGALILALVALLAARWIARGVLAPVEAASRAAERIELGDFSARVPVTSTDEFGMWAERFNRMAAALEDTIGRLKEAQAQNRQFVADVVARAQDTARRPRRRSVDPARRPRVTARRNPPRRRVAHRRRRPAPNARRRPDGGLPLRLRRPNSLPPSRSTSAGCSKPSSPIDCREARLTVPPEPIVIETDLRRLERIVGNLLDNAREHAPGAPVDVSLEVTDGAIVIAVEDRGPGVPADRLERIFDRFYKADPSRHGGSSGLGLAIAAEHAALLGGELRATNRDGGGFRIELLLPVTGSLRGGDLAAIAADDGSTPNPNPQESQP